MKWIHETNFFWQYSPAVLFHPFLESCLLSSFSSFLSPFYPLSVASPSLSSPVHPFLFVLSLASALIDYIYFTFFDYSSPFVFVLCPSYFFLHEFFRFFSHLTVHYLSVNPFRLIPWTNWNIYRDWQHFFSFFSPLRKKQLFL